METILDTTGSAVVTWGDTEEDALYVCGILETLQTLRPGADDYATDHAAYVAEIRGCATMLGLGIPGDADACAVLRAYLIQSRDHEGEASERIIRSAYGKSPAEREAAGKRASRFSGRRGWLDSAADAIARSLRSLEELRAWQARRTA